jgi:hypothetical protein
VIAPFEHRVKRGDVNEIVRSGAAASPKVWLSPKIWMRVLGLFTQNRREIGESGTNQVRFAVRLTQTHWPRQRLRKKTFAT